MEGRSEASAERRPKRAPEGSRRRRPRAYQERSGRNGGASKASCRVTGTGVRIPPSPPFLITENTPHLLPGWLLSCPLADVFGRYGSEVGGDAALGNSAGAGGYYKSCNIRV